MVEANQSKRPSGSLARLAGMGVELAASIAVFCVIGWWIDRLMDNKRPWALIICALLGIIGGLYNLIRRALHESLGINRPPGRNPDRGAEPPDESGADGS